MLVDYFPYNNNQGKRSGYSIGISIPEIFLHLCIWGLIIEEAVEFGIHYHQQKKSTSHIRTIISSYFLDDRWNILDAIAIYIYLVGFITRFIVIEQAFVISKICMCIDLFLWYVRILHLFFAYERLGPKLSMIFNTMKDLAFFIYFIFVFLVAYSISSFALITTPHLIRWIPNENGAPSRTYNIIQNRTDFSAWSLLRNVIDWGVWKIYGQVDLIEYRQVSEATLTVAGDAYGNSAFVLTIIFVCISNVLLLNVLVALFNITLTKTNINAQKDWGYHRFLLVREYSRKSPIPSPLNILYYIIQLVVTLIRFLGKKKDDVYALLDDSSKLDANVMNLIVFNVDNRVISAGTVDKILINFCTAPTDLNAKIKVYIIKPVLSGSEHFSVQEQMESFVTNLRPSVGIQKFEIKPFKVLDGDYVGFKFTENTGCPFSIECASYYVEHNIDQNIETRYHQSDTISTA
ncbi:unnamed protein product [Rotaria sordida]|uniref:Ion transport domain-containing protein n=2 Tax=Rotaria sordida TaxID=392033 RepID=A0A815NJY3_9BILA|nr:unnamed protein product [Rotaria sordida]